MTDEQIVKALECCKNEDIDCNECPVFDFCNGNTFGMISEVLDLINRQKTEIDILIRKKESLRDEISQLQNEVETWKRTADYNSKKYAELVKEMEGD